MQLDIGDIFIEINSGIEYRLNDIDFGWFKLGVVGMPDMYRWIKGTDKLIELFTKTQDSP